jgi:glycosyltransferase involved in cell wall biosynthesis
MQGARAVVLTSLAEGFGLPVAEAFALGTPVITANSGALAEVAGDAALAVDTLDVRALALALARLADDDALAGELSARGARRAAQFTLEAHAARLGDVYRRVLTERRAA